jgi:hypothetical protein
MGIHHNTSFRPILEDDSISFVFKTYICFCLSKRSTRLWFITWPFIFLFHITHFIFTLAMCFHSDLIHPLTFNLIMCECEYGLNAFSTLSVQRLADSHT